MGRYYKTLEAVFRDLEWYREYAKGDQISPAENDILNDLGTLRCL